MSMVENIRRATCMLFLLLFVNGCGKPATAVSGSVTYNGKPVGKDSISFRPTDGHGQSFATKIVDGLYSTEKAIPGKRTVVIRGIKKVNFSASSADSYKAAETRKPGEADVAEAADYIAEDAEGNSQQHEIQPGEQTLDFALTGEPRS